MAFGIMMSDGYVNPQPPVQRAIKKVADAIKALGHEFKICFADSGNAHHSAIAMSGEPSIEPIFGSEPFPEVNALQIIEANIAVKNYRWKHLDYWNSTSELTVTGRPVDAFIMPLAPFTPPKMGQSRYVGYENQIKEKIEVKADSTSQGYTTIINALDYTSYDPELSDGAPVAVQVVGGRLQEENVLAIATGISQQLKR
ncbi:hypothetical protein EAF00_011761 [Botryotinia globosa]|nr:hypothetical protein EAF00_011761 [Botryotinia globosa]